MDMGGVFCQVYFCKLSILSLNWVLMGVPLQFEIGY